MNIVITANGRTLTEMKDGKCVYSGHTLEELEARQRCENERDPIWADRYQLPLRAVTYEEALAIIEERLNREYDSVPPEEITAEDWHEMLNIMPPERWVRSALGDVFRMCEYQEADRTRHYVRIGNRFFRATRKAGTCYQELMAECARAFNFNLLEVAV